MLTDGAGQSAKIPVDPVVAALCRMGSIAILSIDRSNVRKKERAKMAKMMKAAVVREFGKPLTIERSAGARAGPGSDPW